MFIVPSDIRVVQHKDANVNKQFFVAFDNKIEDNSFKKRQETAIYWAGGEGCKKNDIANVPQTGFKIISQESRHSTSNVVWNVIHPTGYKFQIYSDSMEDLIRSCTIENGLIKGRCVIGWNGGNLVLLPTAGIWYDKALTDQEARRRNLSLKDIPIGSLVTIDLGSRMYFLGFKYVILEKEHSDMPGYHYGRNKHYSGRTYTYKSDKVGIFCYQHSKILLYRKSVTRLKILDGKKLTPEEIELITESPKKPNPKYHNDDKESSPFKRCFGTYGNEDASIVFLSDKKLSNTDVKDVISAHNFMMF